MGLDVLASHPVRVHVGWAGIISSAHRLHAASEEDWVRALVRLLDDPDLRRRMGSEGRRRVESRYSAEAQAPRVEAVLRSLEP